MLTGNNHFVLFMKPQVFSLAVLAFLLSSIPTFAQGSAGQYVRRLGPLVDNPNRRPSQNPPPQNIGGAPGQPSPTVPARPPSLSKDEVERKRLEFQFDRAEKGSASAQYDLGVRFLKGDGVEQNEELGRSWLEKAAKQGDDAAFQKLKNSDYLTEKRDEKGRIIRSKTARQDFMRLSGYPNGRGGSVIVHIVPIAEGGADLAGNMKWQTIPEARAKEK
jgi:hypothetical protein